MSTTGPVSEPGGEAGRVRCLYCGANNFPASPTCWQCGRPLQAVRSGGEAHGSLPSRAAVASRDSAPTAVLPAADSALAPRAAAAMGLIFPYVGLPLGIAFLMLDDPRKTQIGWITIGWSVLGTVLNGIALLVTLVPLWAGLQHLLHPTGGAPMGIPGLPNMGGDGAGLLCPWLLSL